MKKIITAIMSLVLIFTLGVNSIAAGNIATNNTSIEAVEYFDDGSYIETVLIVEQKDYSTFASKGVIGTKNLTFKNSDGEVQWTASLTGNFTYTGSSATCTSSSITYSISNSKWKMASISASKSGNQAIGNVTAKRYTFGIPVQTVERTFYITCSATGVLS